MKTAIAFFPFDEIKKESKDPYGISKYVNSQTILKDNKIIELILPDLKTYFKATVIKTWCYWHKDKYTGHKTPIQKQEIKLYIFGTL